MQGEWSLPNPFQQTTFFGLVKPSNNNRASKPIKGEFGGAWKLALRSTIAVLPWTYIVKSSRSETTIGKEDLNGTNSQRSPASAGLADSTEAYLSSSYSQHLHRLLECVLMQATFLCSPAASALAAVVMPSLENIPSKMLSNQLDKAGNVMGNKEDFPEEKVATVDIPHMSKHTFDEEDEVIIEPKTGFQFPAILSSDTALQSMYSSKQMLAGVGLKSTTVMKLKSIKIYAFGLYIRPDDVKAKLSKKYGALPSEELKRDPSFYADLLSHDLGMTVRLMVHYKSLNMGMVKRAFDTSLRNRLKKIKGIEEDEGLEIFNSYFSQDLFLPRGTTIDFRWLPGGQLRTEIDGNHLGTIYSHHLCRAFFDIYIGDPPVSIKAKEDIGENLARILQTS